jgi:hypothetical protein
LPKGVNGVEGNLQMGIFMQKRNTLFWHSLHLVPISGLYQSWSMCL